MSKRIEWLEPRPVSKELQEVIDETNRQIRECFAGMKKIKASLRKSETEPSHD